MLSGSTRIRLLRALHDRPGLNVTEYARALNIGRSDASQELRRIQSRGLLGADHRGVSLIYRFRADPQVVSAAPLLNTLKTVLAAHPSADDGRIAAIAAGLAHPRRIAMLQSIMEAPKSVFALQGEISTSYTNLQRHLRILMDGGWVARKGRILQYIAPTHPLARTLVKLLPERASPCRANRHSVSSST